MCFCLIDYKCILIVIVFVCHDKGNEFHPPFVCNKFTSIVYWKQLTKLNTTHCKPSVMASDTVKCRCTIKAVIEAMKWKVPHKKESDRSSDNLKMSTIRTVTTCQLRHIVMMIVLRFIRWFILVVMEVVS